MQNEWVIINKTELINSGDTLWWSNEDGWVDNLPSATGFTDNEKSKLNLPIDGDWLSTTRLMNVIFGGGE